MNFYSFDEITQAGSCVDFIRLVLGIPVSRDGRCAAVWRGGKNTSSVSVSEKEWYDHAEKVGGGIIQLCQIAKFSAISDTTIQQAQEFLGGWLNLKPKHMTRRIEPDETRHKQLIAEGYTETEKYYYNDLNGNAVHITVRMSHPTKKKEFLQRTPAGWGLGKVTPILYNLQEWVGSPWVVIVEGEKDAETLRKWGIPVTTNAAGAKKWRNEYNAFFAGKSVTVCRDNDDEGKAHAYTILKNIARHAKELKLICLSALPKGDVTDWRDKEGGTPERFREKIAEAKIITPDQAVQADLEIALAEAREANKKPFSNTEYTGKGIGGEKKTDIEIPRRILDLVDECHTRFLGFPRKIGASRLFDHDRDTRRITPIDSKEDLFAWIGAKSKQCVRWNKAIPGAVSKAEFFSAVIQHAQSYEAVSFIPDYPKRPDVYYAHGEIPEPDPCHRFFNRLMDFFSPNDLASRLLIRAMFAAPICYRFAVHRPCWVIDSVDGAGVGKSTLPEMLSYLYDCKPVKTTKQELGYDYKELVKRLISTEGRNSRVLLVDNVTGDFRSSTFAELVTSWNISGKPPYGRGEESRPNNLTYCVTSNSASLDNDIASRSFIIYLKRPDINAHWKRDVISYINAHRFNIFADIIDILENHQPFARAPVSRCPEFETAILQAMCGSEENYEMVCSAIAESRAETNIEEEQARQIEDEITAQLQGLAITPSEDRVFIRSDALNLWMSGLPNAAKISIQDVRNYVKMGLLRQADKKITRYPNDGRGNKGKLRRSGILWTGENVQGGEAFPVKIVGIRGDKSIGIIETVYPT